MANLTGEEHHYRRAMDEKSELPPGTANPPRGRPVKNPPPPHFSHDPHARTPYEGPPPNAPDPRMSRSEHPPPNFHHHYGSGPYSNPPPYSGYRHPPNHPPYRHHAGPPRYSHHHYPQYNDYYWRHNPNTRYRSNPARVPYPHGGERAQECADLNTLVDSLGHEIQDLKNEAASQQVSLKEQLDITANQSLKLGAQQSELRQLKDKAAAEKTEAAVKDEEIKQLKVKNEMIHRKVEEHSENIANLRRRAEQHEKERVEKQTELRKLQDALENGQKEIRVGKAELQKKYVEAKNGRALICRLKQELQNFNKTQTQKRKDDDGLQKTFSEVLDHSNEQGKTIESLVLNMSMQKIEYDHIVDHFISGYRKIYKEFRHLRDIQREELELKEATADSLTLESASFNRPVDVLCMELRSNFQHLDSLSKQFSELSGQTSSQSVPASTNDPAQLSSGWPVSG